jgi:hypothetical protein
MAMTGGLSATATGIYPDNSLGIFGGRRAQAPGQTRSGDAAPESVGADTRWRFEIDDSQMQVSTSDISKVPSVRNSTEIEGVSTLGSVLSHEELFHQYPQLSNIRLVFDESLARTGRLGYYNEQYDFIALSPRLSETQIREVLVHELQHKVQEIEDFSRGTNIDSRAVSNRLDEAMAIDRQQADSFAHRSQEVESLRRSQFETNVTESSARELHGALRGLYEEFFNSLGFIRGRDYRISNEGSLVNSVGEPLRPWQLPEGSGDLWRDFTLLNNPFSFEEPLWSLGDLDRAWRQLDSIVGFNFPQSRSLLEDFAYTTLGTPSSNLVEDFFGFEPRPTQPPRFYRPTSSPFDPSEYRDFAYRTSMGEIEAANAASRLNMDLGERFQNTPESTERFNRYYQWDNRSGTISSR